MSGLRTWPARRVKVIEGVTIKGSNGEQDLRGAIATRPAATAVVTGTTYWAIDRIGEDDELSVSTGSAWVNL